MQQILSNQQYRRSFFVIVVLCLLAAYLVRYVWLPTFDPTLALHGAQLAASVVETLIISFLVTVVIGVFIFWLEPKVSRQANMAVLNPKDISSLLASGVDKTSEWWFRGGTGRYTRAVTVPRLSERGRTSSSTKGLHIQLIDPTNGRICDAYAAYRRGLQSAARDSIPWTADRVRAEVLATVLALFLKAADYPNLNIEIALLQSFSSFRIDLCDDYVVLTKEDPLAPALRSDRDSYFYTAYKDELTVTHKQGRPVRIVEVGSLAPAVVRQSFEQSGVPTEGISDAVLTRAIELAQTPKNPYE